MMADKASALLQFEFRVRNAEDRVALRYVVANEITSLVDAQQVFFLTGYDQRRFAVMSASNVVQVDRNSPTIQHIEAHVREHLIVRADSRAMAGQSTDFSDVGLPPFFVWVPLHQPGHKGRPEGGVVLFRHRAFTDADVALLNHVASVIVQGIAALRGRRYQYTVPMRRRVQIALGLVMASVVFCALIPVRISTVAPAQIVADQPRIVAAPLAGIIEQVVVQPDQPVEIGDLLVRYRQDELIAELRLAQNRRRLAEVALQQAQNQGFVDATARSQIRELQTDIDVAETQIELAQERLSAGRLSADRSGIVVIDRPDEWIGRPVQPGERILQIVDPQAVRLKIDLPAENLIPFQPGDPVSVALNASPLDSLSGVIQYSDFEPQVTAAGVLSFRIMARLDDGQQVPRIGALGTARVYGPQSNLLYQLLRRPIVAIRQMVGG